MTQKRIMVATDGSGAVDRAVEFAATVAKVLGSDLSILTVAGNLSGAEMQKLARTENDFGDALEGLSNQIVGRAKESAHRIGVSTGKVEVAWGDPAEMIVAAVRRDGVDILAVGRRGRGQLAGLLFGSVSQKVASLAPCVVMVIP